MGGKMSHVPYCFIIASYLKYTYQLFLLHINQSHHLTHVWFRLSQLKQ